MRLKKLGGNWVYMLLFVASLPSVPSLHIVSEKNSTGFHFNCLVVGHIVKSANRCLRIGLIP